jgi:hypothetical protein
MSQLIKKLFFLLLGVSFFFTPLDALAQTNYYQIDSGDYVHYEGLVPCGKDVWVTEDEAGLNEGRWLNMPCQFCHLFVMLAAIIEFLLILLVPIIAVGMLVIAGIMYYLAMGNPTKLGRANAIFKGVVMGLALIYGAWLIVGAIFSVIGVASWTGLQSGWYKIDCPVKAVFYESKELPFFEHGPCKKLGPMPEEGLLCLPSGLIMGPTIGDSSVNRSYTHEDLVMPENMCLGYNHESVPAKSGWGWRLPSRNEFLVAWRMFGKDLTCKSSPGSTCLSWDENCCGGTGAIKAYWIRDVTLPSNRRKVFFVQSAGWYGKTHVSAGNTLDYLPVQWFTWGSRGAVRCIFAPI